MEGTLSQACILKYNFFFFLNVQHHFKSSVITLAKNVCLKSFSGENQSFPYSWAYPTLQGLNSQSNAHLCTLALSLHRSMPINAPGMNMSFTHGCTHHTLPLIVFCSNLVFICFFYFTVCVIFMGSEDPLPEYTLSFERKP